MGMPEQQIVVPDVVVNLPEDDNFLLWTAGVIVPLVLAFVPYLWRHFKSRRKLL